LRGSGAEWMLHQPLWLALSRAASVLPCIDTEEAHDSRGSWLHQWDLVSGIGPEAFRWQRDPKHNHCFVSARERCFSTLLAATYASTRADIHTCFMIGSICLVVWLVCRGCRRPESEQTRGGGAGCRRRPRAARAARQEADGARLRGARPDAELHRPHRHPAHGRVRAGRAELGNINMLSARLSPSVCAATGRNFTYTHAHRFVLSGSMVSCFMWTWSPTSTTGTRRCSTPTRPARALMTAATRCEIDYRSLSRRHPHTVRPE
jgi:hypothetical protein